MDQRKPRSGPRYLNARVVRGKQQSQLAADNEHADFHTGSVPAAGTGWSAGEIYIGGRGCAGYLKRAELTADRFVCESLHYGYARADVPDRRLGVGARMGP